MTSTEPARAGCNRSASHRIGSKELALRSFRGKRKQLAGGTSGRRPLRVLALGGSSPAHWASGKLPG